tara:strand:- start:853 stop:1476 length:624 start_codon:yes stop_codon:yes gene_type:complete
MSWKFNGRSWRKGLRRFRTRYRKIRKPINRSIKYEQGGTSKVELPGNIKMKIDVRKVARAARKRRLKGMGLDRFDLEELRARKQEKINERGRTVKTEKIKAERGEYVMLDGRSYTGLYHIHEDGTAMTEATFIPNKSQPLIARNDYIENRSTYRILRRRLRYRNPYRKRRLNLRRRKKPTKLLLNRGIRTGRGGSGGGSSSGGGGGY